MANISSSFTHLLPTELYVAGISTNVSANYTYNGPETFDVHVEKATGKVAKINAVADPNDEGLQRITINAKDSSQLPAAYICSHVFHDNYVWNYTYTAETMSNGDVYQKIDNPDLRDAYELRYDFATSTWALDQIIKELRNDSADEAKRRRDFVKTYADQYSFGTDIDTKIDHYVAGIGTYLDNNPDYKTWKYINLPESVGTIPKIPIEVQVELNKVSINGPIGGNV